jgi:hypothetical protein
MGLSDIANYSALTTLIPKAFATQDTRISVADFARAQQLLDNNDRAGMYLFLADKTGNPAYINTAQISSGSGCTIGGPAIAVNAALQLQYPDLYPNIGISIFSNQVAQFELSAFQISTDTATGETYYKGPSELGSYEVARTAWGRVVPGMPQVVDLFPGNLLLAAHGTGVSTGVRSCNATKPPTNQLIAIVTRPFLRCQML